MTCLVMAKHLLLNVSRKHYIEIPHLIKVRCAKAGNKELEKSDNL